MSESKDGALQDVGPWTTQRAAEYMSCSRRSVDRLRIAGRLRPIGRQPIHNGQWLFSPDDVRDLCRLAGEDADKTKETT